MNGMMNGARLDGMKVGSKLVTIPGAQFQLEVFYLCAMNSPNRLEWEKMNLDPGAAVNKFPSSFGPDGAGDGKFYTTDSRECIPDRGVDL